MTETKLHPIEQDILEQKKIDAKKRVTDLVRGFNERIERAIKEAAAYKTDKENILAAYDSGDYDKIFTDGYRGYRD